MKKRVLLIALCILAASKLFAQDEFITYHNGTENALIENGKTPREFLKLALVAETDDSTAEKIMVKTDGYIKQLDYDATANQKTEKRLKDLFQKVHALFLKKYDEKASFKQLFDSGIYQCVGASILYAYVLEQYQIPYQIKETPTHVYVVAYPDSYNILLETTDPSGGYFVPDEKAKEKYVNELVKEKYLDAAYVQKVGIDQAFNEFFYSKTSITLKQTVGLLYYNAAIEKHDEEHKEEAYSAISKADLLYPAKKHDFLKNAVMDELISNFKFTELKEWKALIRSVNEPNTNEEKHKFVGYEFDDLLQNKLWKLGQKNKVDSIYNYVMANTKDSTLKSNIQDNYLIENGRYAYLQHQLTIAQHFAELAYLKNPTNPMPKALLLETIKEQFAVGASKKNIRGLDSITNRIPALKTDQDILLFYLANYTQLANNAFDGGSIADGNKYLKSIMDIMEYKPVTTPEEQNQIAKVFTMCSIFSYKKGNMAKSIELTRLGLKYLPDNEMLTRRLKILIAGK